jgi:transcriptional regulator with XRE-family HTH domain
MRAARKQQGLTQQEVSSRLEISQSALSKLEHGSLIASAPQWFEFCRLTRISPESLLTGYIERLVPATLAEGPREGTFKLPKRYASDRGSKVRAMLPFLSYLTVAVGEKKADELLDHLKVDADYLIDLDNQLNLEFTLDIVRYLIDQKLLKPKDVSKLVKPVSLASMHGSLASRYSASASRSELLQQLVINARHYECNFEHRIEDAPKGALDLSVTPERHLSDIGYRDETLGDFVCRYKRHYFERFLAFGEGGAVKPVEELECHYQGAPSCIYRFSV